MTVGFNLNMTGPRGRSSMSSGWCSKLFHSFRNSLNRLAILIVLPNAFVLTWYNVCFFLVLGSVKVLVFEMKHELNPGALPSARAFCSNLNIFAAALLIRKDPVLIKDFPLFSLFFLGGSCKPQPSAIPRKFMNNGWSLSLFLDLKISFSAFSKTTARTDTTSGAILFKVLFGSTGSDTPFGMLVSIELQSSKNSRYRRSTVYFFKLKSF
mmetsp:Transcript_7697/g.10800  ORF Transcript_7697/g.10800 Transcript_7697/m.10800 type:complete len:210 (-) Transcript_7697:148-777(-)